MPWYTAVLVRGAHVDGVLDEDRLGDMLYKLIQAPDAESAYARACALGTTAKDGYKDRDGAAVTFEFIGLADLMELPGPPGPDAEVYSQLIAKRPSRMLVKKSELTVFEQDVDDADIWADGEGPVDTSEEAEAGDPDEPAESEPFDDSGTAPLKPR